MRLSVVICNYNTRDALAGALESLQAALTDLTYEIIVVDNASKDGSAAMARERFPGVRVIEPGANLWFTGGNNAGIRAAQGELVWILNPDVIVRPHAAQTMIAYLDTHPAAGAVTCRMIFRDGTLQRNGSRLAAYVDLLLGYTFLGVLFKPWRDRRRQIMWYADWDRASDRPIEVAPGSNLLVRRPILDQIGYFDERLKLYFPEDDLLLPYPADRARGGVRGGRDHRSRRAHQHQPGSAPGDAHLFQRPDRLHAQILRTSARAAARRVDHAHPRRYAARAESEETAVEG